MQPHSYYPLHLHNADETYVIVAGQALWTAGTDIQIRRVGDMIHHPSLMPHAFRTRKKYQRIAVATESLLMSFLIFTAVALTCLAVISRRDRQDG